MGEFPTQTSREFFCPSRELIRASREFGAKPIRASTHPMALKYFIVVDTKNNQLHGCVSRTVTPDFSGPDAPWMRLSSPGSNPQTTDENVFAA